MRKKVSQANKQIKMNDTFEIRHLKASGFKFHYIITISMVARSRISCVMR